MGVDKAMVPVLAVALITWGAVFLYLLRLDRMSRKLEEQARELPQTDLVPQVNLDSVDARDTAAQGSGAK